MKSRLDIAIVGYGTAGQALSVLLSRDGHRLDVFERASHPGPVGAGFLLQPSGLEVLWKMGLLGQVACHAAPISRLFGETPHGRSVLDIRYRDLDPRIFGMGMQRGALFSLLLEAWSERQSLQVDTHIMAVDRETRRVMDQNGRWHGPYDLIIAADGSSSSLREHVQGTALDKVYPWGALWCLVAADDWAFPDELRQRYVAARKMIGLLPVGTRPGDDIPRLSFFWSLPRDDFEQWRREGIPPWLDEINELWPEARERLNGIVAEGQLARAVYRDAVMKRWYGGCLVLAGDAAHSMSPQLGQGVNLALMDALSLRDCLREAVDVADALAEYERGRRAHVAIYHFWSRWLTPLFQSDNDTAAKVRDLGLRPAGRVPGARGHMLRVLTGTQRGWFGQLPLAREFIEALQGLHAEDALPAAAAAT